MPRALIVYYTLSGNSKQVADLVAAEFQKNNIEAIIEEIKSSDAKPSTFAMMKHGFLTMTGSKYKLDNPPVNDPRQFEYVVFGAPVWAWRVCPVLDVWLNAAQYDPAKTNFGAFIQCGKNGFEKSYEDIEKVTGKALSAKTPILDKELKKEPEVIATKIKELVQGVINGAVVTAAEVAETKEELKEEAKEEAKTE